MGFANLLYSWTVLFPIAVLLYYFFRKKYEVKTISSTMFWEQSMRETKVSPYLKNLQKNALFYLQMAALLLLLFILLAPFITKEEAVSGQTIVVVDTSASMLVEKDGTSLFDKHKEAIRKLVNKRSGQSITIVSTGKEPMTVIREEKNAEEVISAINQLKVSYEHEFMERAIEFTQSIAADSEVDIHIFTDSLDQKNLPEASDTHVWTVNTSNDNYRNVSIDKFGAVATADGTEAIIKLINRSDKKVDGNLILTDSITGTAFLKSDFMVEGEEELLLSFKDLPTSKALTASISVDDDYAPDNAAHIILGNEATDAIIDNQLHELIKKAFEAVGLSVSTGSKNELTAATDKTIVVTNDAAFLESGTKPIVLIGRNDEKSEEVTGAISTLADSLFSVADLSDVYVSEVYPAFDEFETIAMIGNKPFIQRSSRGDIVILADVEMTDWPLHASFPLFIWSAIERMGGEGNTLGTFTPNERKAVLSSSQSGKIEVYTVDDEYVTTITDSSSFIAPQLPGVYKARDEANEKLFTVQLEPEELNLETGSSYRIGKAINGKGTEANKWLFGKYFILPVLLLMLMEWEVQRRRGYPH
ncbi:VWA domain-containing protein [Sporosarcina sp. Marseille-Q4063]|uniref:vWA domain-containing protein n=1 Tax=Sporosarcina sp. Marseille-Q4063 TaxID=2810514 RepID=UPI001BAE672F|nr:BatA and WFA domain-containing protein [Sporosarcina sp. Marseille-Q4063]QUW21731.1 VWA domain-containing protein [Sporosarcina sp. Marseille-Q4063]